MNPALIDFKFMLGPGGILVFLAAMLSACHDRPPAQPPIERVNGVYANACCGSVQVKDGVMVAGGQSVSFTLEVSEYGGFNARPARMLEIRGGREFQTREMNAARTFFMHFAPDLAGSLVLVLCPQYELCASDHEYVFRRN